VSSAGCELYANPFEPRRRSRFTSSTEQFEASILENIPIHPYNFEHRFCKMHHPILFFERDQKLRRRPDVDFPDRALTPQPIAHCGRHSH
jgi:hypothetical protein